MTQALQTTLVPVADLRPHPNNYRGHPPDQLDHIVESMRAHGIYRNVVLARDQTILAGHGVVEAARKLGLTHLPCVKLDLAPDDPRALKILVGDNEIAKLGEVDDRALTEMLKEIQSLDSLLGTGFDEQMLAALVLVTRPASEIKDANEAAEWAGMPEFGEAGKKVVMTLWFRDEADRERLIAELGLKPDRRNGGATAWWPPKDKDDLASVQFQA